MGYGIVCIGMELWMLLTLYCMHIISRLPCDVQQQNRHFFVAPSQSELSVSNWKYFNRMTVPDQFASVNVYTTHSNNSYLNFFSVLFFLHRHISHVQCLTLWMEIDCIELINRVMNLYFKITIMIYIHWENTRKIYSWL